VKKLGPPAFIYNKRSSGCAKDLAGLEALRESD
jgi:hypothetical protein